MSTRNKRGVCAYCGQRRKLTADHVPPRLLLEQPFPPDLWVVPACAVCNQSFKADDEYTRTILALDLRATWNYAAQCNLPRIIRSLKRPSAKDFVNYLARQCVAARIVTPSGAEIQAIRADTGRINRTGMHIMRGLYFRESHKSLSSRAVVRIGSKAGLTADHPDMLVIARLLQQLPDHRDGSAGTAFSYFVGFGDRHSAWIMLLYDYFFWVATVDEGEASDQQSIDRFDRALTISTFRNDR